LVDAIAKGNGRAMPFIPSLTRHGCELSLEVATDPWVTKGLFDMGRMGMDDFGNMGEYVSTLMQIFEDARRCTVFFAPSNLFADTMKERLEHRLTVIRANGRTTIDETGKTSWGGPFDPALSVFANRTPTVYDYNLGEAYPHGIRMVFDDLDRNSDRGNIYSIPKSVPGGMVGIMPFYYRESDNPSGVVWLEGDLRARNSRLEGFSKAYWAATLAMSASSQISLLLTHRFDSITNLPRRVDFEIDLKDGIRGMIRDGKGIYMMFIDLDDFKRINDDYTHPIGDEILKQAAEMMQRSVRTGDMVARVGGEEFAVKVECDSHQKALEIAERIRANVDRISVWVVRREGKVEMVRRNQDDRTPLPEGAEEVKVTCSMGVIDVRATAGNKVGMVIPPNGRGDKLVQDIYSQAYSQSAELLHHAKSNGKNCVYYRDGGLACRALRMSFS
jgi:diguanylate cyclase (GGDEF)-like protein